jgi:hypothetical protein
LHLLEVVKFHSAGFFQYTVAIMYRLIRVLLLVQTALTDRPTVT